MAALRWVLGALGLVALAGCTGGEGVGSERTTRPSLATVAFTELPGRRDDNLTEAASAFRRSCPRLIAGDTRIAADNGEQRTSADDWKRVCQRAEQARDARSARTFFEQNFQAFSVGGQGVEPKYTAYYEPDLRGSKAPSRRFTIPVYKKPSDLQSGKPYLTRAEIENGALRGKGLEVAWVEDPIGLFEMQIQGGGRVALSEGGSLRLGFDGTNNRPYTAIGNVLIEMGVLQKGSATWPAIRDWLKRNPQQARDVMRKNERYIFFRDTKSASATGAEGVPLTAQRSLAVDTTLTPYGTPIWIDTVRPVARKPGATEPYRRLTIAQDTGAAIVGPARGDVYFGNGSQAADWAGRMNSEGRAIVLIPNKS